MQFKWNALGYAIITLCLLINLSFALTVKDFQGWGNITAIGPVSLQHSKIRYWLENQERFGMDVSRLSQLLLRGGLGYELSPNTSIWLGYAWIYTTIPFAKPSNEENRIWQQILWAKTVSSIGLTSRTRFEERFFSFDNQTRYRLRQLFKLNVPFKSHIPWSLVSTEEVYLHLPKDNHSLFDQNRFFIGLGYAVNKNFTIEAGYLNQTIKRRFDYFQGNDIAVNFSLNNRSLF